MKKYPTPHINASPEDFAKTVLMPGDPLRAKFIAENYLEDPVLINSVRGMLGYTGRYKGKKITVMASGMAIPMVPGPTCSHLSASALQVVLICPSVPVQRE